jgi:hypothetical protein
MYTHKTKCLREHNTRPNDYAFRNLASILGTSRTRLLTKFRRAVPIVRKMCVQLAAISRSPCAAKLPRVRNYDGKGNIYPDYVALAMWHAAADEMRILHPQQ